MAKLICGVNEITNESFNGKTIEEAMETAGPLLNIPADNLVILVNGDDAEKSYVIQSDDEVEFVKAAGTKGRLNLHE
jgi:hypothetical protein